MFQIQIGIGESFPISLVLLSNGKVVFIKTNRVNVIYDQPDAQDAVPAMFTEDGFSLRDENFSYNVMYAYKEIPNMLKWLQQQSLIMPQNVVFEM